MRFILIITFFFLSASFVTQAQVTLQPRQLESQDVGVIYEKEFGVNVYWHTRGFGLGAIFGDIKSYYKTNYYHVDFGFIKHAKEHRPDPLPTANALKRPYVYGKKNNFMVLRAGKGMKRYLSEKAKRRGLAVGYSVQGGPSIGMLKPYFLEVNDRSGEIGGSEIVKFSNETADYFLDRTKIQGYAGFWRGFNDIDFLIGGHIKGGLHLAWGAYDKYVKNLEVGLMLDFYFREVEIMVIEDNAPVFANLYINLQLGRRK